MRLKIRLRKALAWGALLVVAVVAGGLGFAYAWVNDSQTLAAWIRERAPRYLPGSSLTVDRVRLRLFDGQVTLVHVLLGQRLDGQEFPTLRVAWLQVRHDFGALLRGRFEPREVVVAQPTLRITRRRDGTWNLQGLLADPWPDPPPRAEPVILVQNGTVHLADGAVSTAILRDVSLRLEPRPGGQVRFEGSAKGGGFDRLKLEGSYDRRTGRLALDKGELTRLAISATLRQQLPAGLRARFDQVGLTDGEVDLVLKHLAYDPKAKAPDRALRYEAALWLRSGAWTCRTLPFPLNNLAGVATLKDDVLAIETAEGTNGKTIVRVHGTVAAPDPERGPMDVLVQAFDLEIDERLRARTPATFQPLWDEFRPRGRVNLALRAVRDRPGAPPRFGVTADCRDVAMTYHLFPYALEHVSGLLTWEGKRITIAAETLVGGKRATCAGTIDDPGPDAHVRLDFEAAALPIDRALLRALPGDVRQVVDQFQPSGTVRASAQLERTPPTAADPKGKVAIHAVLDLDERCAVTWAGLPYPITNLTGRLELHPDRWIFQGVRGGNGVAVIEGSGQVEQLGPGRLRAALRLRAEHLPFDAQLKRALQPAWQATWGILNPSGSSTVEATIAVEPGREHYHLVIVPEPDSRVQLKFVPRRPPGDARAGEPLEMPPMERVAGRFVFDDGRVAMTDVRFQFHGAPVKFRSGTVQVEDTGRFALAVRDLTVADFRLDAGLRKLMPPVMAQFARRLDESTPLPLIRGDLALGWSGRVGEPAWCSWSDALVVFNGQTIQTDPPLRHIQGQMDHVRGRFDGQDLQVHGRLDLESVNLLGQQVTRVRSPLDVEAGRARLDDVSADLLGGELTGRVVVGLDATPTYSARLAVREADLGRFTKTLPGRQSFRGLVSGELTLAGMGNDLRTLKGSGGFQIAQGDLGELPVMLRLVKFLNLSPATKTAFDAARVTIGVQDGRATLDPIQFTGDAFSLRGAGTLDLQGDLDLRLRVLYGRDKWHVPVLSDAMREASGRIFDIHVTGSPAFPQFRSEVLPQAGQMVRSVGARALRGPRAAERKTGKPE